MAVTRKHASYALECGATLVGGITQQSIRTGSEVRREIRSSEVYSRFQSLVAQKPGASGATNAIAALLDITGMIGASIDGFSPTLLNLYAQKHTEGGTRDGTLSHRKYTINEGMIVPRRLTCNHQGDAVLTYDVVATYDGSNDPIVITDSQTLPSGIVDDERFTIGPATIESVSLPQIRGFDLDFGVQVVSEGADSDYWDTFVSIESVLATLTLRGIDIEWLKAANIPLLGLAATHANTSIYLKKRAAGGTFVADITAEHIKMTAAGLAVIDTPFDADHVSGAECNLRMQMEYDGTNAPIVLDTTSAIT